MKMSNKKTKKINLIRKKKLLIIKLLGFSYKVNILNDLLKDLKNGIRLYTL